MLHVHGLGRSGSGNSDEIKPNPAFVRITGRLLDGISPASFLHFNMDGT